MYEKRSHFRKSADYAIEFADVDGKRRMGVCRNLSLGGMSIETPTPAAFGAKITVYIQLKGIEGLSAIEGMVRWHRDGLMGVQFGLMGARQTYALTEMLAT